MDVANPNPEGTCLHLTESHRRVITNMRRAGHGPCAIGRVLGRHHATDYQHGASKIMISTQQMRDLPDFFTDITDLHRAQGRRFALPADQGDRS